MNIESLIMGGIGGVIAWYFTSFAGASLIEFHALRREALEAIRQYTPRTFGSATRPHYLLKGSEYLGDIAARLESLAFTNKVMFRLLLPLRGFRAQRAAQELRQLARCLPFDVSGFEIVRHRIGVQRALRLSISPDDSERDALRQRLEPVKF